MNKKKLLKQLGKHIAKVRKSKGFSQDRIYLESGFSRGTMSKIENGLVNPKILTLARIAEIIGVPLKRLVDIED